MNNLDDAIEVIYCFSDTDLAFLIRQDGRIGKPMNVAEKVDMQHLKLIM